MNRDVMSYFDSSHPATIREAFDLSVSRHPKKAALMHKVEVGKYQEITFEELDRTVRRLTACLFDLGVRKGDRIAIFAYNGVDCVLADLATLKLGGIVVPLYHTLSSQAVKHILADSESRMIFVAGSELHSIIEGIRPELPSLTHIAVFNDRGIDSAKSFLKFQDLVGWHRTIHENELPDISSDDTATIVYTSGTTGVPKGVMLSHGNIVSNAFAGIQRFKVTADDSFLSFLPFCHMFEKTCGLYTMLFAGAAIAYAGGLDSIVADVQTIRPTILIAVPRILEKVYEAVESKVMEDSFMRRWLVLSGIRNLNERINRRYRKERVSWWLDMKCAFYDRYVAARFRKIAGGRLRILVSGGAPLNRKLAKTLLVLGFNILEGYGLTETSPVVCTTCIDDNRLGTVGKPLEGVEIKIGEHDEVLVRGSNVMKGYHKLPEETAQAIDGEGWFHTEDQGKFDEYGNLIITGRIKELIVTSYGKNIAPIPIEAELMKNIYIDQAVLFGDNRKYIIALIIPSRKPVERFAQQQNIAATGYSELLRNDAIRNLIASEIEKATADCSRFEKVRDFLLVAEPFSVANELMTPTMKLRRKQVFERYRSEIEAMYAKAERR